MIDKGNKVSELIINVGSSLKSFDRGITGIVGSSLKAGTNLISTYYISQQGRKIHLIFQNSEEEMINLQQLNFAYSQLNEALQGQKDYDLFGILDSRYHSAFKVDYQIYEILNKQVNIWPDRSLNRERIEKIYSTLQSNLSDLDQEINVEFSKLKLEDQADIRKDNELKIEANQARIINQENRIKDLESQIETKKSQLANLITSIKSKLESNHLISSERIKKNERINSLFQNFLDNSSLDPKLTARAQDKKVDLNEITNLQASLQKLQEQLTKLESEQLENQIVQLDIK